MPQLSMYTNTFLQDFELTELETKKCHSQDHCAQTQYTEQTNSLI
jgi:hypothetical protein